MDPSRLKASRLRRQASGVVLLGLFSALNLAPLSLWANPSGASVVAGTAAITQNGNTLNIANSNGTIINWQSFSIGAGEVTRFLQPSAASAVLNRVVGGNLSTIYGTLQSNGQVFLINPSGVLIGAGGIVNTAGFVASTLDVSDAAFSQYASGSGQLQFLGNSNASVQNLGTIYSRDGNIFLIAQQVDNGGLLSAPRGTVGLYASSEVELTTGQPDVGSVLVSASALPAGTLATGVTNSGLVKAVQAELKATGNMYALAVNNTGAIKATGATVGQNGVVHFTAIGGTVRNSGTITARNGNGTGGTVAVQAASIVDSGTIDANGANGGGRIDLDATQNLNIASTGLLTANATLDGNGGTVNVISSGGLTDFEGTIEATGTGEGSIGGNAEVSGEVLDAPGLVDLRGPAGDGNLLFDPGSITIDAGSGTNTADVFYAANIQTDLLGANVTLSTTNGTDGATQNITLASGAAINWAINTLTLLAGANIDIAGTLTATGSGNLVLHADSNGTGTYDSYGVTFTGSGAINFSGSTGTVSLFYDPTSYASPTTFTTAEVNMGSHTANFFPYMLVNTLGQLQTLATQINAGTTATNTGDYALGTNIDDGNVNFTPIGNSQAQTNAFSGVFNGDGYTISNLTINQPGSNYVGLFGTINGGGAIVENLGLVNVTISGADSVGALMGENNGGTITNCYATGAVTGSSYYVGGLVGLNNSNVEYSYATGTVTGNSSGSAGGLVGSNAGTIEYSYALENVSASGGEDVGGLTGHNGAIVEYSYAVGTVSGSILVGGVVGDNEGELTEDYYNSDLAGGTGIGSGGSVGVTGLTTTQMMTPSQLTGLGSFTAGSGTWYIAGSTAGGEGNTYPILQSEFSNTITNSHQLELIGMDATTLAENYTLANNINLASDPIFSASVGFTPIGSSSTPFTGLFNGNGDTLSNLAIDLPSQSYVGLFGYVSGTGKGVENLALVSASVTGNDYVGGLVGYDSGGTVQNSSVAGSVVSTGSGANYVGGLVGDNDVGAIVEDSYETASVTGIANVGGVAGQNYGTIENSYAAGSVTGTGQDIGGLLGDNDVNSVVENSYATGAVSGGDRVGGLVGYNGPSGSVVNSYETGAVTGSTNLGGVVGYNYGGGVISANYFEQDVNASLSGIGNTASNTGAAPLTLAQMALSTSYAVSWDFSVGSTWGVNGYSGATQINGGLPYFQWQNPTQYAVTASNQTVTYGSTPVQTDYTVSSGTASTYLSSVPSISQVGANQNAATPNVLVLDATTSTVNSGYTVEFLGGIEIIVPATLTYTANATSRTYGAVDPAFTGTVTGFVLGQTLATATTGTLAFGVTTTSGSDVGAYAINGSGLTADNGNYVFVQAPGNATAYTINPAILTYTADTASRVYGASDPTYDGTVTGMVNGETLSEATSGTASFATTAVSTSNVGSYAINGSGLTAINGDYTFVQASGNATALTINPATLTYTADLASRTYGASDPAFTGTITGFVLGQTQATATTGTMLYSTTAVATSNVGSYGLFGFGLTANNGNYTLVQAAGNSTAYTINPTVLSYSANAASRGYGASDPTYTGTVTGFVLGQTQATATTGSLAFNTTATGTSDVGSYTINGSGLTANSGNYTFVQAAGNSTALTITPALLTVALTGTVDKVYDGTTAATLSEGNYQVSGLVNGDSLTLGSSAAAYASANVGSGITVSASGVSIAGAKASDYTLATTTATGAIGTITPASLVITADDESKTALDAFSFTDTEFTASGLQDGQTLVSANLASSGATRDAAAGDYAIQISGAVGSSSFHLSNYNVSYVNGILTVNPAPAAEVVPAITTQVSNSTTQAAALPVSVTLATSTSGAAGGTDTTVGTGSNGDPDTGSSTDPASSTGAVSSTGSGKKSATLGSTPPGDANAGTGSAPVHETVAVSGSVGSIGMHGIGVSAPPPPEITANFNKVLGPAVMSELKRALQ